MDSGGFIIKAVIAYVGCRVHKQSVLIQRVTAKTTERRDKSSINLTSEGGSLSFTGEIRKFINTFHTGSHGSSISYATDELQNQGTVKNIS